MCWIWFHQQMSEVFYTVTQNLQTACTMECRWVGVITRCKVGLNLVMGKLQHILSHHNTVQSCMKCVTRTIDLLLCSFMLQY